MTITFKDIDTDRARNEWESGLLAAALLMTADFDPAQQKQLLKVWLPGMFNGASSGAADPNTLGAGEFMWIPADGERLDLAWRAPYGVTMLLGRVYQQPNGSFASLVVAGVKDDMYEAMAAAEWAIARLSS